MIAGAGKVTIADYPPQKPGHAEGALALNVNSPARRARFQDLPPGDRHQT